jgi:hypothetical protein
MQIRKPSSLPYQGLWASSTKYFEQQSPLLSLSSVVRTFQFVGPCTPDSLTVIWFRSVESRAPIKKPMDYLDLLRLWVPVWFSVSFLCLEQKFQTLRYLNFICIWCTCMSLVTHDFLIACFSVLLNSSLIICADYVLEGSEGTPFEGLLHTVFEPLLPWRHHLLIVAFNRKSLGIWLW